MADSVKPTGEKTGCPSCDLQLTVPGEPGHVCITYEEQAARVEKARGLGQPVVAMPDLVHEMDQA